MRVNLKNIKREDTEQKPASLLGSEKMPIFDHGPGVEVAVLEEGIAPLSPAASFSIARLRASPLCPPTESAGQFLKQTFIVKDC